MIHITTREIAELTLAEQQKMERWTHNVLVQDAAQQHRKTVRLAIATEEELRRLDNERTR